MARKIRFSVVLPGTRRVPATGEPFTVPAAAAGTSPSGPSPLPEEEMTVFAACIVAAGRGADPTGFPPGPAWGVPAGNGISAASRLPTSREEDPGGRLASSPEPPSLPLPCSRAGKSSCPFRRRAGGLPDCVTPWLLLGPPPGNSGAFRAVPGSTASATPLAGCGPACRPAGGEASSPFEPAADSIPFSASGNDGRGTAEDEGKTSCPAPSPAR